MKKSELIKKVEVSTKCEGQIVEMIIDSLLEEITIALKNGEHVSLHGFGKFSARKYGVRKCYNPVTKELITLNPSVQPAFNAGPKLRATLNNK